MGIGAVASIVLAVELRPGVYVDLRSALIATAGLFGGPVSATIAATIAIVYRLAAGGAGAIDGAITIVVLAVTGSSIHLLTRRRSPNSLSNFLPSFLDVVVLAAAVAAMLVILAATLPTLANANALGRIGAPALMLNSLAVVVFGFFIIQVQRNELERDILRAAFSQSPDYFYVKDRESRFVAANERFAAANKLRKPADMIGLSDFDLTNPPRAEALYFREQEIMRSGAALIDHIERIDDRYFLTSMVPLRNAEDRVIGLTGVTRDITEQERLERELRDSKNLLSHALAGMSDGFAMFDRAGFLIFCNEQYRSAFPMSAEARIPGAHIHEILRRVAESGERQNLPADVDEAWIHAAAATLHKDKDEEIQLTDGRWKSLRTRLTADGTAMVVVSDITAMKEAEISLRISAEQLRNLAETDGLTGLINRRTFDEMLATEAARSVRDAIPLSVMMIDIDHFKAYNDTYGHPAGDQCLRGLSQCLKQALKRPGDIAARYGGEEFIVILPDTDDAGARIVAEGFISSLRQQCIAHSGSESGRVTASIGIASVNGRVSRIDTAGLVRRADAALYDAKKLGRDRVRSWRQLEIEPQLKSAV